MLYAEPSSLKKTNRFEAFAIKKLRIFKERFQDPVTQVFPPSSELKISYIWKKYILFIIDTLLRFDLIQNTLLMNDLKSLRWYLSTKRKWKKSALRFESLREYTLLISAER